MGRVGLIRMDSGTPGRGLSLTVAPGWGAVKGGAERLQTYRETPGAGPKRSFKHEGRLEPRSAMGYLGRTARAR